MKRPSNGRARWCARVISAPSVQKRTAGTSWPAWNGKWPLPGNRRLRTSCSATPARITAPGTISPSRVGRRAIATPTSTSARNRNASGLAASEAAAKAASSASRTMGVGRRSVIRRVLYLRGRRPAARVHGPAGQTPALILAESLTLFLRSGTFRASLRARRSRKGSGPSTSFLTRRCARPQFVCRTGSDPEGDPYYLPSRSGAVALLELLAGAAPAGVVAADVVPLRLDDLLRAGRDGAAAGHRHRRGRGRRTTACGRDRVRAGERLVLVLEVPVRAAVDGEGFLGDRRLELGVEQRQDDLLPDRAAQLLEPHVPLVAVLDERVLLRHSPQVDALAQVVHRVEVLTPPLVDDLEDHEALELARQLGAEVFFLRGVGVARVVLELFDQHFARDGVEILTELVDRDLRVVQRGHRLHVRLEVPLLGLLLLGELVDRRDDRLVDPFTHLLGHVLALEHLTPLLVDHLALAVHDVVVLEDVLARDEVLLLDLLLRVLDLVREDLRLHRLVLGDLETLHDPLDPVAGEQAHELVVAGEVEPRLSRIALATGAPAQLVVDPARLVPLGPEHVQAAEVANAVAELDVDAAAGHVRRDRDRVRLARVLDDLRLARVLLRVEDVVGDAVARQQGAQVLGCLHRNRADEHRLALLVALPDVAHHGQELAVLGLEDE